MTTFEDGPAHGTTLSLARSPRLLRVVIGLDGKVDALDLPDDLPNLGDVIHVYELRSFQTSGVHINYGGGRGAWVNLASYRHLADVDGEALGLADTDRWRAWAREHDPKELHAHA